MQSGNCVSLDHSALLPASGCPAENGSVQACTVEGEFGAVQSQTWLLPAIAVTSIRASLKKNLHVRHYENTECSTVNSCYVISGGIRSSFAGLPGELAMSKGCQNFIYKPEIRDDHFLSAGGDNLSMLHVAVDRAYFIQLLRMEESWCGELKRRVTAKQPVFGGDYPLSISPAMYRSIGDIMNCPISGSLGNILLEAKVLELMVYQLHQYNGFNIASQNALTRADREVFHDIKEYLRNSYNDDHSLRSLSRQFAINEFKLKKGFRELFGTTVFGYIHALKMDHARAMMEEAGITVAQAARQAGYKNPNHFSVAFKKQFGLSPSLLRRSSSLV